MSTCDDWQDGHDLFPCKQFNMAGDRLVIQWCKNSFAALLLQFESAFSDSKFVGVCHFLSVMFLKLKKYRAIKKGSEERRRSFMYIAKLYWLIPESVERFKLYSLLLLCSMLDFQLFKGIWFAFPFQQWARQPTCRCDSFLFSNIFLII